MGCVCGSPRAAELTTIAKIDPVLRAQLDTAGQSSAPVSAVIKLRPKDSSHPSLPPGETQQVADTILKRVRESIEEKEHDYYVLDMLGAFNLVAPVDFVAEVVKQPEVASAVSADSEEPALIAPRNTKEVHLKIRPGRTRR